MKLGAGCVHGLFTGSASHDAAGTGVRSFDPQPKSCIAKNASNTTARVRLSASNALEFVTTAAGRNGKAASTGRS
jgi:hypothetical protein